MKPGPARMLRSGPDCSEARSPPSASSSCPRGPESAVRGCCDYLRGDTCEICAYLHPCDPEPRTARDICMATLKHERVRPLLPGNPDKAQHLHEVIPKGRLFLRGDRDSPNCSHAYCSACTPQWRCQSSTARQPVLASMPCGSSLRFPVCIG